VVLKAAVSCSFCVERTVRFGVFAVITGVVLVDALPRLDAVEFGGNAMPSGINRRIALMGLTVRSRTRDCAQPLLSETFKVGRPLSATKGFETFTRWKTSRRNQCFTSQRTAITHSGT